MKHKIAVLTLVVFILGETALQPRTGTLPAVSKLKEKVERAKGDASVRKTTIQDLLGQSMKKTADDEIAGLCDELDALVWSADQSFVQELALKRHESHQIAGAFLYHYLLEALPNERFVWTTWMHKLKEEHMVLEKLATRFFALMNKKDKDGNSLRPVIQQGIDRIGALKSNLTMLLTVANDLLTACATLSC